jgi:aminotransferase
MTRQPYGSSRVRRIAASATKEMALLAARIGGCVSLGQGVVSFPTPPHVLAATIAALQSNPASSRYSLQPGMSELRQTIASYLQREKGITIDPDRELCVTVGGMEALLATMLTVVDQGDEVVLPSPSYASYIEQIHLAGGIPKFVPLTTDWQLDPAAIRAALTPRTRAIILCNPGNPTGTVFSNEAIWALARMAADQGIVIITDEAYDFIIYEGEPPRPLLAEPSMREQVISIYSLSKKYSLTGWRIGWVAAAEQWMGQIMKVHDAATICAPTPSQFGAIAALTGSQQCVEDIQVALHERRQLCCERLDRLRDYFAYVAPRGAFYVMARYLFSAEDSLRVATRMLEEARVITIPGGAFGPGGEGHLRLSFGAEPQVIAEAFDRIEKWLNG